MERKVWRLSKAGSLKNLRLQSEDLPDPSTGEVRIRVVCVGLNFADVFACQGLYSATPAGSFVPGLEFSGVVEEPGANFKKGDKVTGVVRFGAYASHLNADVRYLRPLPESWSFAQGAAFPTQALTAYYGLVTLGDVRRGQTVLVHSVAGGVGLIALAILDRLGAKTVGTVGTDEKIPFLLENTSLTKDRIIVRNVDDFPAELDRSLSSAGADGFDIVFDAVYGDYFQPAYDRLNPGGRFVLYGSSSLMTGKARPNYLKLAYHYLRRPRLDPLEMISDNKGLFGFNLIWLWERIDELNHIYDDLTDLKLKAPHVGHEFAFEEAPDALSLFQTGRTLGKVVLTLGGS